MDKGIEEMDEEVRRRVHENVLSWMASKDVDEYPVSVEYDDSPSFVQGRNWTGHVMVGYSSHRPISFKPMKAAEDASYLRKVLDEAYDLAFMDELVGGYEDF